MAITVSGSPYWKLKIAGALLDIEDGIVELSSSQSDDEAGSLTVAFAGQDAASSNFWAEGTRVRLEYGWNGTAFGTWEGTLERSEPEFGGTEKLTLSFFGASYAIRDGNTPDSVKGTPRDIAEKIIRRYGLKANVTALPDVERKVSIPEGASGWQSLEALARQFGCIVAERGADTIYIGKKDAQRDVVNFYYRQAPNDLTPTVMEFRPVFTRKKRLKKVTVVGTSARSHERYEGVWEYTPRKRKVKVKDRRGRNYTREVDDNDDRTSEVTLYLPVRDLADAQRKAKAIGERNEARSRSASLIAPIAPVLNGDVVRLLPDDTLGRYAGAYYVTRVEFDHLAGTGTYSLEFKE